MVLSFSDINRSHLEEFKANILNTVQPQVIDVDEDKMTLIRSMKTSGGNLLLDEFGNETNTFIQWKNDHIYVYGSRRNKQKCVERIHAINTDEVNYYNHMDKTET